MIWEDLKPPPRHVSAGAITCVLLHGYGVQVGLVALACILWMMSLEPLTAILGLVPALCVWLGLRENLGFLSLLRHGVAVPGRLVKQWTTERRSRTGRTRTYHYRFEYPGPEGELFTETVSNFEWPLEELTDEPAEAVLYEPRDPSRAVLLDRFHGRVSPGNRGEIRARSELGVLLSGLPAATVVGVLVSLAI